MPNSIILRTIAGVDDKRISLANGQIGRLFDIPGGWNSLRIGLRLCINPGGVNIGSGPHLAVGLCAGTTNMLLDSTTTHFVGAGSAWSSAYTMSYNAGPPPYYTPNYSYIKRVGNVGSGGSSYTPSYRLVADTSIRTWFIVQITKGSPNYTIAVFAPTNSTVDTDLAGLLLRMEETTSAFSGYAWGSGTVAVNEATDGVLNAVNIAWDRSTPAIEISDIVIGRMS